MLKTHSLYIKNGYLDLILKIFYALSCIYIYSYIESFELIWTESFFKPIAFYIQFVWIISAILNFLGFHFLFNKILFFLSTSFLLVVNQTIFTVEELFILWISFFSMFLTYNSWNFFIKNSYELFKNNFNQKIDAFPIYLIGIVFSISVFSAGYTKLIGPLWFDGYGFYYTFLLPWIKDNRLSFLLDYEFLMVSLNYLAIVFELITLPLFLFSKTRKIASLMLLAFTLILVYPINGLGYIGFFGTIISLLLVFTNKSNNEFKVLYYNKLLVFYILFYFLINLPVIFNISYPKVFYPLKMNNVQLKKNIIDEYSESLFFRIISIPNYLTTRIMKFGLFNSHHTLGLYVYKIELINSKNESFIPFKVFNNNKTASEKLDYFDALWYQNQLYPVSELIRNLKILNSNKNHKIPENILNRIINLSEFSIEEYNDIKQVVIKAGKLKTPKVYKGNYKEIKNQKWETLSIYFPDKDSLSINYNFSSFFSDTLYIIDDSTFIEFEYE